MVFNPTSPGVYINEVNASTVVPVISTTVGAISGIFNWGPLFSPTLITSQQQLVSVFGKPNANNYETWFSAFNFLEYGSQLFVVRTSMIHPIANATVNNVPNTAMTAMISINQNNVPLSERLNVTNSSFSDTAFQNYLDSNQISANTLFAARFPGGMGNSIRVGVCASPSQYHAVVPLAGTISSGGSAGNSYTGTFTIATGSKTGYLTFANTTGSLVAPGGTYANVWSNNNLEPGDFLVVPTGNRQSPFQYLPIKTYSAPVTNATLTQITVTFTNPFSGSSNVSTTSIERYWEFYRVSPASSPSQYISSYQASSANPTGKDLMSVVVVDSLGYVTGTPNTVLEVWNNVSRAKDAVDAQGNVLFYKTIINNQSKWLRIYQDLPGYSSNTANNLSAPALSVAPFNVTLLDGNDGDSESLAPLSTLINGWELFQGAESIRINLVIAGKSTGQSNNQAGVTNTTYYNYDLADWLINNIAERRKDCVVFFSPDKSLLVNNAYNFDYPTDLVNWASLITSSDKAFLDCNYKYQYDQYNSVFRWVPFNGDTAGLCVYTDTVSYPWFSPAGFNRGQIRNVTKLAWNPQQGARDFIYPNAINPIVAFPGQGVYLYGDRTFTIQPSAFDRINVRRMFLYIEQSIKIAARYTLFEINDIFTQNAFKNMVTPFLKNVQANRGITDFQVICDGSINTAYVVDSNQFLCAILVKPARSINYINISFFAVPDGVDFSTVPLTF